jgi:ribosome maturation factor RimP
MAQGTKVPYFVIKNQTVITKDNIRQLVTEQISGTGIFLVDVRLSSTGRITVLIDRPEGLKIEDCVMLSKHISNQLGEELGDFELNVSSPGLDMPLLVTEQFIKNEGKLVDVVTNEGDRIKGVLMNVTKGGFDLKTETKVKKETVTEVRSFNFEDVKTVKVIITFK